MQKRLFLITCGIATVLVCDLRADPLKSPRRLIGPYAVDLTPLFHWWTNRAGERPLAAWVHITGPVLGTNSRGWVLEARTEGVGRAKEKLAERGSPSGETKIILKNPPRAEQAEFEALKAQLRALNAEHDAVHSQVSEADRRVKAIAEQQKGSRQHHTRRLAREASQWRQTANAAKDQLKPLEKQIRDINTKLAAFPDHKRYALDCLALDTGEKINGLSVYDYGVVLR
jgi:N-methylhydantoinase B/oxoprolinase/acetone carboxylase alpha subunit